MQRELQWVYFQHGCGIQAGKTWWRIVDLGAGVDEVWGKNKMANAEDILLTTMGYTQLHLDFLKPKQSSIQVPTNQVPDRKRYRQTPKTTKPFLWGAARGISKSTGQSHSGTRTSAVCFICFSNWPPCFVTKEPTIAVKASWNHADTNLGAELQFLASPYPSPHLERWEETLW